jgi:hypothetical protein
MNSHELEATSNQNESLGTYTDCKGHNEYLIARAKIKNFGYKTVNLGKPLNNLNFFFILAGPYLMIW